MKGFNPVIVVLIALAWSVAWPVEGSAATRIRKKPKPSPTAPAVPEGSLVGLYNNPEGLPLIPLLGQAKDSIDIEIYQVNDQSVRDAIRQALARGVKVRIVKEPAPVGAACRVFEKTAGVDADCVDQRKLVQDVRNAGGTYVPFNKAFCGATVKAGQSCVEHGKIVLADRKLALVSTGNFDPTNLCDKAQSPSTCNRDYSVILDDADVVATLQSVFDRDVEGKPYDLSAVLGGGSQKVTVSPLSEQPLVDFIRSARTSVQVQNQYLKEPGINDALLEVAGRGVHVEVMVASACAFGKPSASDVKKFNQVYGAFDQAGIESRMFTKKMQVNGMPGYLHAKTIVIDGNRAWVGSVNGSTAATSLNREYGVFFERSDWVTKLASVMSDDQRNPNSETWQESLDCLKDR